MMMVRVNEQELSQQIGRLIERVQAGEAVEIVREGRAVARLICAEPQADGPRVGGRDRGLFEIPQDFDQTPPGFEDYT